MAEHEEAAAGCNFEACELLTAAGNHLPHEHHKGSNGRKPDDDTSDQESGSHAFLRRSRRRHAKVVGVHTIEEAKKQTALAGFS